MKKIIVLTICLILPSLIAFADASIFGSKVNENEYSQGKESVPQVSSSNDLNIESSNSEENNASTAIANDTEYRLYFSLGTLPVKISGYQNAVLNDYHNFPIGTGKTYVDFEKGNIDQNIGAVVFGYEHLLDQNNNLDAELLIGGSGSVSTFFMNFGYNYSYPLDAKMRLIFGGKIGIGRLTIDGGTIEKTTGSQLPIITKDSTFFEGDKIESISTGTMITALIQINYDFNTRQMGFFQIAYITSSFSDPTTKIAGVEITDSEVFDSGTSTDHYDPNSNIDPVKNAKVEIQGLALTFGMSYSY